MLDLSKHLPRFTVFYNGPQCGASAPDHFHFQAGEKGYLLIEKELNALIKDHAKAYFKKKDVEIYAVDNCLRRFLAFVSPQRMQSSRISVPVFFYGGTGEREPMLNVLAFYEEGTWKIIIIFPREKQRPSHFLRQVKTR
jgi:hypothetical protein